MPQASLRVFHRHRSSLTGFNILRFIFVCLFVVAACSTVNAATLSFVLPRPRSSSPLQIVPFSARFGVLPARNRNRKMSTAGNNKHAAEEDAAAYNNMISVSVDITSGYVRNGILTVTRSARDLDSNSRRNFQYQIPIPTQTTFSPSITFPTELPTKIKAQTPSPSGTKTVILIEEEVAESPTGSSGSTNAKVENTRQVLEIWMNGALSQRIVLPMKIHGKVSTTWFASSWDTFSWSPNEDALVYCAERKAPQTQSFFDKPGESENGGNAVAMIGGQHTLKLGRGEDWGEKFTGTCLLALFCVHVTTGNVCSIDNVPCGKMSCLEGGYTFGQPIFSPCGTNVVYTGWDAGGGGEMPRRLGATYCYQRRCKIYASPVTKLLQRLSLGTSIDDNNQNDGDKNWTSITLQDELARSPRFSFLSDGSKCNLAFLCSRLGFDTHGGAMALHTIEWDMVTHGIKADSRKILVQEVRLPSSDLESDTMVAGMAFPGLFVDNLPNQCVSPDGSYIMLNTQWGSVSKVIRISTKDGTVSPVNFSLSNNGKLESCSLASQSIVCMTNEGGAIVCQSEPNRPMRLGFIPSTTLLASNNNTSTVIDAQALAVFCPINASSSFSVKSAVVCEFTYRILNLNLPLPSRSPKDKTNTAQLQSILLLPKKNALGDKKIPLIVVPHGGPHSCTSTSFIPSYAYLCQHGGYAILHVNYRGSTGFGQAALESLTGNVGSLDVEDVVYATNDVIRKFNDAGLDPDRVGICGGSHGGFLVGHLIGQYPNMFKAAAMRNPVTNIATMVTATDIPDWCYIETFGSGTYDWATYRGPRREELGAMWDASPIAHVENVKAPTLIALGMADRRVPPSQGLEYYYTLRSRGVKNRLLMYEKDDHPIDRVASEADLWLNIKRWFDEHL